MDTMVLLLVVGASTFGTRLLLKRLLFESPVVYGCAPYLAIIGLLVIVLSLNADSLFLLSSAIVTATICGSVWLGFDEPDSKFDQPSHLAPAPNTPDCFKPQDLPFQRRESRFPPAKGPTPHGYRITSTGKRLSLVASNPRHKNSHDRKRPTLKSVD